jgi:hypothetical protein
MLVLAEVGILIVWEKQAANIYLNGQGCFGALYDAWVVTP